MFHSRRCRPLSAQCGKAVSALVGPCSLGTHLETTGPAGKSLKKGINYKAHYQRMFVVIVIFIVYPNGKGIENAGLNEKGNVRVPKHTGIK